MKRGFTERYMHKKLEVAKYNMYFLAGREYCSRYENKHLREPCFSVFLFYSHMTCTLINLKLCYRIKN